MLIGKVLTVDCTAARKVCSSKKKLLEMLSSMTAGRLEEDSRSFFDAIWERERIGTTAIGGGVALPHCETELCDAPVGALVTLSSPVDFDAPDGSPVDIVFASFFPKNPSCNRADRRKFLSNLENVLSDKNSCKRLLEADNRQTLYSIMVELLSGKMAFEDESDQLLRHRSEDRQESMQELELADD